jgi:hypothetical protein
MSPVCWACPISASFETHAFTTLYSGHVQLLSSKLLSGMFFGAATALVTPAPDS